MTSAHAQLLKIAQDTQLGRMKPSTNKLLDDLEKKVFSMDLVVICYDLNCMVKVGTHSFIECTWEKSLVPHFNDCINYTYHRQTRIYLSRK